MKAHKSHISIALAYFILAALLGTILRAFALVEMGITYKFFVHTHSHIALLGWVYVALTTLIYTLFVQSPEKDKKYRKIFWFTQFTLLGMLVTFPFTGYAQFSIVFSTLFLFASYWFFWFFKKYSKQEYKKTNSYKCISAALWFMICSSIGPWLLGGIMNILGPESIWYRMAIYYYLHFQYNGWMILALIGLLFFVLERKEIHIPKKRFRFFFWIINLGIVLSFFLSTLFANPPIIFNILGGMGALLQVSALVALPKILSSKSQKSKYLFSPFQDSLLMTIIVLLFIKMGLQLLTAIPYFANLAATVIDFTVGYLHFTFLGVVTMSLFFFLDYFKMLKISKKPYLLYVCGFMVTEALIFYKGIAVYIGFTIFSGYFEVLAMGSFLIPISLVFILGKHLKFRKEIDDFEI